MPQSNRIKQSDRAGERNKKAVLENQGYLRKVFMASDRNHSGSLLCMQ